MVFILFVFQAFFMHAVYPRKTTLLNIPVRQAVGFLVKWSGTLFFLCLISFDTMLDLKPQTQLLS